MKTYFIFPSTRIFVQAMNLAEYHKINFRTTAIPERITTDCGMSLMVTQVVDLHRLRLVLSQEGIPFREDF